MNHDSERDAAAYLGGRMAPRHRRSFESHLMECEQCWREVHLGREGRRIAESGRFLAPQGLKERVRASIGSIEPVRKGLGRRGAIVIAAAAIALLAAGAGMFMQSQTIDQPVAIQTVLADFKGGEEFTQPGPGGTTLPRQIGDLRLKGVQRGRTQGLRIESYDYSDSAGHDVTIYIANQPFPTARGAHPDPISRTWSARVNGAVLFCADYPMSSLVVGDDPKEVSMAVSKLGLG